MGTEQKHKTNVGYYFATKKHSYFVVQNEDGTLFMSYNGTDKANNIGGIIYCRGGIDAVLSSAKEQTLRTIGKAEITAEEYTDYLRKQCLRKRKARFVQQELKRLKTEKTKEALGKAIRGMISISGGVFKSTPLNICMLLRYLSVIDLEHDKLPKMSIGYTCQRYDFNGRSATAITLDEPITCSRDGEKVSRFVFGAPAGSLPSFTRLNYIVVNGIIRKAVKSISEADVHIPDGSP